MTPSIEEALRSGAVREAVSWAKYYLNRGANDLGVGEVDKLLRLVVALGNAPAVNGEQKPVAWRWRHADRITGWNAVSGSPPDKPNADWEIQPLYAASPDHTPALLALIEERDRLKVERDEASRLYLEGVMTKRALASEAKCDALREALAALVSICRPGGPATPARAIYDRALTQETNDVGE